MKNNIKNGILIHFNFNIFKYLINLFHSKLKIGMEINVENNEVAKIIGIGTGYYPEVSYDIIINGRLDERRESALLRLIKKKIK